MNRRTREDQLIKDVFSDVASEGDREASLEMTLAFARRRKVRRQYARSVVGGLAVCLLAMLIVARSRPPIGGISDSPVVMAPIDEPVLMVEGTAIRVISDEELFNLFPDQRPAIVGAAGDLRLVFLSSRGTANERE